MRKFILSAFLLFSVTALFSQAESVESLLKQLGNAKGDTNKVTLLLDIEKKYFSVNLDSALYFNKECEKLISKQGAQQYQHQCFHEFVRIYHAKGDYRNALDYCLKSIRVAVINNNKFQEANSRRALFNIYHNLNMNDSAVKYAMYSIKLTKEIGDTNNVATNYGNLCWLYMDLNQFDKALAYGLEGIQAGEHYKDTVGLLISINNLAMCYLRTYNNTAAIGLLKRQIEIGTAVNRARSIKNALINLATIYYNTGNVSGLQKSTNSLNEYINRDPNIENKYKGQQNIINAYNYIYQKEYLKAEGQLQEALKIATADSLNDQLLIIYLTMSKLKFAQLDFVAGNFYDQKWDSLNTTAHETELSEYALELETKYETEKKSSKILLQEAQLRQKSTVNYLLLAAGFGLLIISLLTYRTFSQKHKLQQQLISDLETRQLLTATEAVLKGEEQERTRLAKDLHDGLGGMLSGIKYSFNTMKGNLVMTPDNAQAFERSMDMLDSSIKEMRRVAHNMMPESLVKFGLGTALKDFCTDINNSGALQLSYQAIGLENAVIEQTAAVTIYRIVQELINNTMKHAGAKTAIVQVTKIDGHLSVTVEDDGKGFDTTLLKQSKGIGWSNIQNRVEFLKGTVDVKSEKDKGTSVYIELDI